MLLWLLTWSSILYKFLSYNNNHFVIEDLNGSLELSKLLYRVNRNSGSASIFVSSLDNIFKINAKNIEKITFLSVGPRNFSLFCEENKDCNHCSSITLDYPPGYSAQWCYPRLTHNVVKSWNTLNPFHHKIFGFDQRIFTGFHLYTCFSLYHGFCTKIHTKEFKRFDQKNESDIFKKIEKFIPAVGWNPHGSSTLFVDKKTILVIHQTDQYESHSLLESFSYTIRNHNFSYPGDKIRDLYSLDLIIKSKPPEIKYFVTFKSKNLSGFEYIYTIFSEKSSVDKDVKLKMSRICSGDEKFNSFMEIDGKANYFGPHTYFNKITHVVEGRSGRILGDQLFHEIHLKQGYDSMENLQLEEETIMKNSSHYDIFISAIKVSGGPDTVHDKSSKIQLFLGIIEDANLAYDRLIRNCFEGKGTRGPKYLFPHNPPKCEKMNLPNDWQCLIRDHDNRLIISENASENSFKLHLIDEIGDEVTGLAVHMTSDLSGTLLFVNVNSGHILKYELLKDKHGKYGRLIEKISLTDYERPEYSVHLQVDITGTFAYSLSRDKKLIKTSLHNCSRFKTCSECLSANDPVCGWCIDQGRCCRVENCLDHPLNFNPDHIYSEEELVKFSQVNTPLQERNWLSNLETNKFCPILELSQPSGIFPTFSSSDRLTLKEESFVFTPDKRLLSRLLDLTISSDSILHCVFCLYGREGASCQMTKVTLDLSRNYINCTQTLIDVRIDNINLTKPIGELEVRLVVERVGEADNNILAVGIVPIIACGTMTSCFDCVNLQVDCVWCTLTNKCQYRGSNTARDECLSSLIKMELATLNPLIEQKQIDLCPQYSGSSDNPESVYEGSRLEVSFNVKNIPTQIVTFICLDKCGNNSVHGILLNQTMVKCTFDKIELPSGTITRGSDDCIIEIYWQHNSNNQPRLYTIDSDKNIHVKVYNCEKLAEFCDDCLALPREYGCGFCQHPRVISKQDEYRPFTDGNQLDNYFGKCTRKIDCEGYNTHLGDNWIVHGQICPNPRIIDVLPKNTTHFGKTILTIDGHNLGRNFEDIFNIDIVISENNQMDFNSSFRLYANCKKGYVNTRRIKCMIDFDGVELDLSREYYGMLRITIGPPMVPVQWKSLRVLMPKIDHYTPRNGPMSGGTKITFHGTNLNVGNEIKVFFGNNLCKIIEKSDRFLKCLSEPLNDSFREFIAFNREYSVDIDLYVDGMKIDLLIKPQFTYKKDPEIITVHGHDVFESGGTMIKFYGQNLDIIQEPKLIISPLTKDNQPHTNRSILSQVCLITNESYECLVPNLKDLLMGKLTQMKPGNDDDDADNFLSYGLSLNNHNPLSSKEMIGILNVHSDPIVKMFIDTKSGYREEIVTPSSMKNVSQHQILSHIIRIYGAFPTSDKMKVHIRVYIQETECIIENVLIDEIRCSVQILKKSSSNENIPVGIGLENYLVFDQNYQVYMKIGKNIIYDLGEIRFKYQSHFMSEILPMIVIASTITLIILLIFIFVMYLVKRNYSKKKYLKNAIDRVIAEQQLETERSLKEGFVAIQNACVKSIRLPSHLKAPIRNYQWFASFILFPELYNQLKFPVDPIMFQENPSSLFFLRALNEFDDQKISAHMEYALNAMYESLKNAKFFGYVISLLDQTLYVREKCHVVSLITGIFHDDLTYLTSILVDQIHELCSNIDPTNAISSFRSVENFVVKLMSNWLILLSYDYLKENVSKPLYELLEALREMIQSEAQDCVTGTGVASLNLDKILKGHMTPSSYKVFVYLLDREEDDSLKPLKLPNYNGESSEQDQEHSVISMILLSCDTVGQAKSKILTKFYKSTPFTKQLKPFQFDLAIKKSDQIKVLADFNQLTPDNGMFFFGLKMPLNQLADFNITNGSIFQLIRKPRNKLVNPILNLSVNQEYLKSTMANNNTASLYYQCDGNRGQFQEKSSILCEYADSDSRTISSGFHSSGHDIQLSHNTTVPSLFHLRKQQISNAFRVNGLNSSMHWYHLERTQEIESSTLNQKESLLLTIASFHSPINGKKFHRYQNDKELLVNNHKDRKPNHLGAESKENHRLPIQYYSLILKENKNKLIPYLDHLIEKIFDESIVEDNRELIVCFKFLFNLFDIISREKFNSNSERIAKAWKINCIQLLLWNQLLMNPDYFLDIELVRNTAFSHSFHTICQVLSYASVNKDQIPKRLSINEMSAVKNIFIQDILNYSKKISRFTEKIDQQSQATTNEDLRNILTSHCSKYGRTFNRNWLLLQFYKNYLKPKKHLIFEGKLNYVSIKNSIEEFQRSSEILESCIEL